MIFRSTYNKPILLVGNGVRASGAVAMVHQFARKTNIPVLTTMNGVDLVPEDLHIGFIGTHGNRIANMITNECDLIISVGARLGIRQVGRTAQNFAPKADLIRADIDEYELSRNIKDGEKKYHTDAKDFMRLLLQESIADYSLWRKNCLKAKQMLSNFDKQEGNLAIEQIGALLAPNAIVAVDVGQNQCWCAQSLVLKGDNARIHIGGGYGTMGCALPYAIGSSIASNKSTVICIAGDGGFQMNIQELETVKRENLPIKMLILNNKVLGKISETQYTDCKERFANTTNSSGYTVPDFCKIANAYGIKAITLNSYKDLVHYRNWFLDNDACVINIMLPEHSLLTPKISFETSKMAPALDNSIIEKVKAILQS